MRVLRLRRLVGLELLEECPELIALIRRQQCEDTVRRLLLTLPLRLQPLLVVGVDVARVDLHDIMDQAHHHDMRDVDLGVAVLAKQVRHDGHVPRMLRIALATPVIRQMRLPVDFLLLIDLQDELPLLLETFLIHLHSFPASLYGV